VAIGNGLSLNPKKTMAKVMDTAKYINILVQSRITVNGIIIPYNDSVDFDRGVTISNTLS